MTKDAPGTYSAVPPLVDSSLQDTVKYEEPVDDSAIKGGFGHDTNIKCEADQIKFQNGEETAPIVGAGHYSDNYKQELKDPNIQNNVDIKNESNGLPPPPEKLEEETGEGAVDQEQQDEDAEAKRQNIEDQFEIARREIEQSLAGKSEREKRRTLRKRREYTWGTVQRLGEKGKQQPQKTEEGEPPKKRKRKSRWETEEDSNSKALTTPSGGLFPKDITLPGGIKVILPPALTGEVVQKDPELQELYDELNDINRKIMNNIVELPPSPERSPSPEPQYDKQGIRINSREVRFKEKLMDHRQQVIEKLIQQDPAYKPPADYRPTKKWKKIYIPTVDGAGHNYIGLIIGPRGNTQKRMQKETNTKIAIRGKGSIKEGTIKDSNKDGKYDYGEDERLHVLITGDTQQDVNNAAIMIENLLRTSDEERNEHKKMQLRELAALNGTLKEIDAAEAAGPGQELFQLPEDIQKKVNEQYMRDVAKVHGTAGESVDSEYASFLKSLGGGPPEPEAERSNVKPQLPGEDLPDDQKLFVGNLSPIVTDNILRSHFEQYGTVAYCVVIMNQAQGTNRGYGFVHTHDSATSRLFISKAHGSILDGRTLTVKFRSSGGGGGGGSKDDVDSRLYVSHMPSDYTEDTVRELFSRYGSVKEVRVICDKESGKSKGFGFVSMSTQHEAQTAMNSLHGFVTHSGRIQVKPCKRPDGSSGPLVQPPLPPIQNAKPAQPPQVVLPHGQHPYAPPGMHPQAYMPTPYAVPGPPGVYNPVPYMPGHPLPPGAARPPPYGLPPGPPAYPGQPPYAAAPYAAVPQQHGYQLPPHPGAPPSQPGPYPLPSPPAAPGQPPLPGSMAQPPLPAGPAPPLPGAPPQPAGQAPPLPPGAAPLPPSANGQADNDLKSEYDKFMTEMENSLPGS